MRHPAISGVVARFAGRQRRPIHGRPGRSPVAYLCLKQVRERRQPSLKKRCHGCPELAMAMTKPAGAMDGARQRPPDHSNAKESTRRPATQLKLPKNQIPSCRIDAALLDSGRELSETHEICFCAAPDPVAPRCAGAESRRVDQPGTHSGRGRAAHDNQIPLIPGKAHK